MPLRSPGRVILLIEKGKEKKIMEVLGDRLVYHEKPLTNWVDRAADWLAEKINLDKK